MFSCCNLDLLAADFFPAIDFFRVFETLVSLLVSAVFSDNTLTVIFSASACNSTALEKSDIPALILDNIGSAVISLTVLTGLIALIDLSWAEIIFSPLPVPK